MPFLLFISIYFGNQKLHKPVMMPLEHISSPLRVKKVNFDSCIGKNLQTVFIRTTTSEYFIHREKISFSSQRSVGDERRKVTLHVNSDLPLNSYQDMRICTSIGK